MDKTELIDGIMSRDDAGEIAQTVRAKINASKRKSYEGGAVWAAHNPDTSRCRCVTCNRARKTRKKLSSGT